MNRKKEGMLIVLSGPSGCGKDTLLNYLASRNPDVRLSISATTRERRKGELDGVHYHFISRENFSRLIEEEGVLEYAQYDNNLYGTPRAPVDSWMKEGKTVVLIIEVQGAEKIRRMYPDVISIFLLPPSMKELEQRLRERGTDSEDSIKNRMNTAKKEVLCAADYDYIVVNREIDEAVEDISAIMRSESLKVGRSQTIIKGVMNDVES